MVQVDACTGAVVLAGGVDGLGGAKAALVVGQGLGLDVGQARAAPAAQLGVQVGAGVAANHGLGQRRGLDQVEPVVVGARKVHVGAGVHVERGGDVDHAQFAHACCVVQRQAVRHAAAAVVAAQEESVVPQRGHKFGHVLRHGAFAVVAVVGLAGRVG
ncbi:hypothetical protein D3C72_1795090 [compost metagenome]